MYEVESLFEPISAEDGKEVAKGDDAYASKIFPRGTVATFRRNEIRLRVKFDVEEFLPANVEEASSPYGDREEKNGATKKERKPLSVQNPEHLKKHSIPHDAASSSSSSYEMLGDGNHAGPYNIEFDDGDKETNVPIDRIKTVEKTANESPAAAADTRSGASSPTADAGNISPKAPHRPGVGDKVEANYRGRGRWYPGVVASDNSDDGTFDIDYDDGEKETSVEPALVRKMGYLEQPSLHHRTKSFDSQEESSGKDT
eukprot:CAMPEP_0175035808 /NCGR_PEP_ID=MMETSP0005-20121125/23433_1 /TAXON_ID=420556 /ORGANISM="Ochromonas sp., Strain CCMP1393" /LENGTH=256 /DNA_ID=CAMNT_0016296923 /DNA_START=1 /DNA_END=769 /DNA_ORIENTATION=+